MAFTKNSFAHRKRITERYLLWDAFSGNATWEVVAHQQYILDHEQTLILHQTLTVGLLKHLSPYIGRISN